MKTKYYKYDRHHPANFSALIIAERNRKQWVLRQSVEHPRWIRQPDNARFELDVFYEISRLNVVVVHGVGEPE